MRFFFEAMDATGGEVIESIEAENEAEAKAKIRQRGLFVTKITHKHGTQKYEKVVQTIDDSIDSSASYIKSKPFHFIGHMIKMLGFAALSLATASAGESLIAAMSGLLFLGSFLGFLGDIKGE